MNRYHLLEDTRKGDKDHYLHALLLWILLGEGGCLLGISFDEVHLWGSDASKGDVAH